MGRQQQRNRFLRTQAFLVNAVSRWLKSERQALHSSTFTAESLESRTLLSSTSPVFNGDAGTMSLTLRRDGDDVDFFQNTPTNGSPTVSVPYSELSSVTINAGSGPLQLNLDFSGGDLLNSGEALTVVPFSPGSGPTPVPVFDLSVMHLSGGSYYANSTGLSIYGSVISDAVNFSATPSLDLFSAGGAGSLEIQSGSYNFNSDLGDNTASVDMTVDAGATASFSTTQHLNSLTINSNGVAAMAHAGGHVLVTNQLTVNGVLDLTNNDLIVQTPDTGSNSATVLQEQVAAGVNQTATQGIIESTTASMDGMTIGVDPAAALVGLSQPLISLDGQSINQSTAIVARYVLPGDVNIDGAVDDVDFSDLAPYYGKPGAGTTPPELYTGDINYDGVVDSTDFGLFGPNFGNSSTGTPVNATVAVAQNFSLPTNTPDGSVIDLIDVNWGDGTVDTYNPNFSATVSHVYTSSGLVNVQMVAILPGNVVYAEPAQPVAVANAEANDQLGIDAANSDDAFSIASDGNGNTIINETAADCSPIYSWNISTASLLTLNIVGDGAGVLTADFSNGNPLPTAGLFTDSGSLNLNADDRETLFTSATAATLGTAVIRHPASTAVTLTGTSVNQTVVPVSGTLTIVNNQGATDPDNGSIVFVNTSATVLFDGSQFLQTLNILPGATARMLEDGTAILNVDNLQIVSAASIGDTGDNGGVLDLVDNALIAHGSDTTALTAAVANGYDGGKWDGQATLGNAAIISSVAEQDTTGTEAIGYALVGSDSYSGQISLSSFGGQSVENDDFVARFTYYGDANLDGVVDGTDLATMTANQNSTLSGWSNGDFNYSGTIDADDYALFNQVYVSAPTNLAAVFHSSCEIDLSWIDHASTSDHDLIYGSIDDGETFSVFDDVGPVSAGDTNTDQITGLIPDTSYVFYVEAQNARSESNYIGTASETTATLPVPQNLVATAAADSPNEVDLSWNGFDTTNATQTNIYISTDGVSYILLATIGSGQTYYPATGLSPRTSYTFKASAVDAADNQSDASNAAPATTIADPWTAQATGGATAPEDSPYTLSLSIAQQAGAPAFGYWLIDWGDQTTPSRVDVGTTNVPHTFATGTLSSTIQATAYTANGAAIAMRVAPIPTVIDVVPKAPTNLHANVISSSEVDLTWVDASESASGYVILRTDNAGSFNIIGYVDAGVFQYDDTSLAPSSTVQYEAEACGNTVVSTAAGSTSVTTPTAVPIIISLVQGTPQDPTDTSATLTWNYLGLDYSGFEVEMEDTGDPGTNFYTVCTNPDLNVDTTGAVPLTTGAYTATGLNGGENYKFRIRADYTDGLVSDYVNSGSLEIRQSAAPGVSVSTVYRSNTSYLRVGWSGAVGDINIEVQSDALPGGTQWYGILFSSDDHGNWPQYFHGSEGGWDYNNTFGNSDQGYVLNPEVFGSGTYTYRVRSSDVYGNATAWSNPASYTYSASGPTPAPLGMTLSSTGTTITVSWPIVSGSSAVALLMQQDSVDGTIGGDWGVPIVQISGQNNTANTMYTGTIGGLTPGTTYDFDLWTSSSSSVPSYLSDAFFKDSIATTGVAPATGPAGPSQIVAVRDPKNAGQADIHWTNTSNNETGFVLQESVDGGATWRTIDSPGVDKTYDQVDISGLNPGTVVFQVMAAAPTSQPATSQPITIVRIILVAGNFQSDGTYRGVDANSGVQNIYNLLTQPSGGFTNKEVEKPLPADAHGDAVTGLLNLEKAIASAGNDAPNGQPVQVALIGYSLGGGLVYDAVNDMRKAEYNATHPNQKMDVPSNTPPMPANVTIVATVYVDAINTNDGHFILGQASQILLKDWTALKPVTLRPPQVGMAFDYYQSQLDKFNINTFPNGAPLSDLQRQDVEKDLDSSTSENGWKAQLNLGDKDLGDLPGKGPDNNPANPFNHLTIDKDDVLHAEIVFNMQHTFHRMNK